MEQKYSFRSERLRSAARKLRNNLHPTSRPKVILPLEVTTVSSACQPAVELALWPLSTCFICTGLGWAMDSGLTTQTKSPLGPCWIAADGTVRPSVAAFYRDLAINEVAYGHSLFRALGKVALSLIVPVAGSTTLLTTSTFPRSRTVVPSCAYAVTGRSIIPDETPDCASAVDGTVMITEIGCSLNDCDNVRIGFLRE